MVAGSNQTAVLDSTIAVVSVVAVVEPIDSIAGWAGSTWVVAGSIAELEVEKAVGSKLAAALAEWEEAAESAGSSS